MALFIKGILAIVAAGMIWGFWGAVLCYCLIEVFAGIVQDRR